MTCATATSRPACSAAEAEGLRRERPERLEELGRASVVRHVRAMLELRRRGAVVFDYGNNIRPQAAEAGLAEALELDVFTQRYLRPLFCRGIGPFRWICASGDAEDQAALDDLCAETFAGVPRITDWIELARRHVPIQGLPARIAWLGHGERRRFARAANAAVREGRLQGPGGLHARPHGLRGDDPPVHHQRGDAGRLRRGGRLAPARRHARDRVGRGPGGAALGRRRLRRLLRERGRDGHRRRDRGGGRSGWSGRSGPTRRSGVLRHADAGYDEAIDCAREFGLGLPEEDDARA